jgi:multidrug efflux pump subunit AcrA (membrane-fusion protein)
MKLELQRNLLYLAVVFSLAGCSAFAQSSPQALPTIVLGDRDTTPGPGSTVSPQNRVGGVAASGVVAPAQEAKMVSTLAGKIQTVMVTVGDRVTAGQPLIVLEGQEDLEAAISASQFELVQAQQALADLTKQAETDRVQALQDIITFEKSVRDAQYALDNFTAPSNQATMDTVEALNQMKLRLDQARLAFEPYKYRPSSDPIREDMKEALDEAQAAYNSAVKRLQYEYDLEVAEAQLAKALSDYEILKTGPDPDKVQLAEARLANAQTQLAAAQAALEDLTLTAPFDSTVSMINKNSGEWVIPGETILVLLDLDHLRIETTDLSERDIPGIEIGQPVTAFIEALQQEVSGQVSEIAPLADTLGGDVVYKTVIELDSQISGLRAGMSVEVQFGR